MADFFVKKTSQSPINTGSCLLRSQRPKLMMKITSFQQATTENNPHIRLAILSIKERGMKRFVAQIFAFSGKIVTHKGEIKQIILNPFYPIVDRFKIAFQALLQPYEISVVLGKT